jgi:hypothetical protein
MAISEIFAPWDQVSTRVSRKVTLSSLLWTAGLVGLLFAALVCGLWAGMSLSSFLCAPDSGVMDSPG